MRASLVRAQAPACRNLGFLGTRLEVMQHLTAPRCDNLLTFAFRPLRDWEHRLFCRTVV